MSAERSMENLMKIRMTKDARVTPTPASAIQYEEDAEYNGVPKAIAEALIADGKAVSDDSAATPQSTKGKE